MGLDLLTVLLSAIIFFVYGSIFVVSVIFTLFIDTYHELDRIFNVGIINSKILAPLDINIDFLDVWLFNHHKIVGPILIFLSIIDLRLSFDIIDFF